MKFYKGACHCGKVRFEIEADIDHVRSCDCSVCRKRGALNFRIPKEKLNLLTPWDELTLYQWGSKTAKDYFCPNCGILPFRQPAALSQAEISEGKTPFEGWAVNVRCLEGIDLDSIPVKNVYGSKIKLGT